MSLNTASRTFQPTKLDQAQETTGAWLAQTEADISDLAIIQEWKSRFLGQHLGQSLADQQGRAIFSAEEPGKVKKALSRHLGRHELLRKEESSLLVQARTGRIGLRKFLFQRRVPGIATPLCECGEEEETVQHLLGGCRANLDAYDLQQKEGSPNQLLLRLQRGNRVRPILHWLMGKLPEYRLALELADDD